MKAAVLLARLFSVCTGSRAHTWSAALRTQRAFALAQTPHGREGLLTARLGLALAFFSSSPQDWTSSAADVVCSPSWGGFSRGSSV